MEKCSTNEELHNFLGKQSCFIYLSEVESFFLCTKEAHKFRKDKSKGDKRNTRSFIGEIEC